MTLQIYVFRNVLPFLGLLKVKSQTTTVPHFSYQGMEHLLQLKFIPLVLV